MNTDKTLMGIFVDEAAAASAILALEGTPWRIKRVHSPFPSHKLGEALKAKKSPVGWFTLAGGILGFFTGLGLAVYTAVQWNLIVWGKPVVAWIPFIIVGFEFTILFAVFGNVMGLIVLGDLPEFRTLKDYDPRFSGGHFGVLISCEEKDQDRVVAFFKEHGGEAKILGNTKGP
jgi:hypothetical protein